MANYSVDIEVGINGKERLANLRREINILNRAVDKYNKQQKELKQTIPNLNTYNAQLAKTERLLGKVTVGGRAEREAVIKYVDALQLANKARDHQLKLIDEEMERRGMVTKAIEEEAEATAKLTAVRTRAARSSTAMQGPALPPQLRGSRGMQLSAQRRESLMLGAGFPLLFGGGPGAVLGGVAGGLMPGKGFGAQIFLSAIGAQLDAIGAEAAKTAQALNTTMSALEMMREKSLFSSNQIRDRAAALEEQGRVEELSTLLTKELTDKIGNVGVNALQELGKETDETARLWGELTIQLQALIAGPLKDFLEIINSTLRNLTAGQRLEALRKDLAGTTAGEALEKELRQRQVAAITRRMGKGQKKAPVAQESVSDLVERFTAQRPITARIPVTPSSRKTSSKEAEKLKRELQRSLELAEKLDRSFGQQVKQLIPAKGEAERRLNIEIEYENRAAQVAKIKQGDLRADLEKENIRIRELEYLRLETEELFKQAGLSKEITNALGQRMDRVQEGITGFALNTDLLDMQKEKLDEVLKKYPLIGQAAQEAAKVATFGAEQMIAGTKNVEQVFADFLRSIADLLMRSAAQMISTYIAIGVARMFAGVPATEAAGAKYGPAAFGAGGPTFSPLDFGGPLLGRANGGSVTANKPYMVGERGPELFVPGAQGNIVPNNAMGGANVVVNVDASGSNVEGDGKQAKALGSAIALAVQNELVKQKKPGGLLY